MASSKQVPPPISLITLFWIELSFVR